MKNRPEKKTPFLAFFYGHSFFNHVISTIKFDTEETCAQKEASKIRVHTHGCSRKNVRTHGCDKVTIYKRIQKQNTHDLCVLRIKWGERPMIWGERPMIKMMNLSILHQWWWILKAEAGERFFQRIPVYKKTPQQWHGRKGPFPEIDAK